MIVAFSATVHAHSLTGVGSFGGVGTYFAVPIHRHLNQSILLLALVGLVACGSDEPGLGSDASTSDASPTAQADANGAFEAVPSNADALFAYLQARSYEGFAAEPAVHASAGPHGQVRSFFNASLAASLTAGDSAHAVGAATVKELHSNQGLEGWAVMVKTGDGASASDWYFYEVFSTTDSSEIAADGNGVALCANCHGGGTDFILTEFP